MKQPDQRGNDRPQLDWSRMRMKSRQDRVHKVAVDALGKATPPGCTFGDWFKALPDFLGASELHKVVAAIVAARRAGRPVVFAFGGHVIKTGCSPLVVDLICRGVITAIATSGSGAIHDLELAETGATSEEVADTIRDGSFGMVHETCARMNAAARLGVQLGGLGRALCKIEEVGGRNVSHICRGPGFGRRRAPGARQARGTIFTPASFSCASISDATYLSPKPSRFAVTRL